LGQAAPPTGKRESTDPLSSQKEKRGRKHLRSPSILYTPVRLHREGFRQNNGQKKVKEKGEREKDVVLATQLPTGEAYRKKKKKGEGEGRPMFLQHTLLGKGTLREKVITVLPKNGQKEERGMDLSTSLFDAK